MQFLKTEGKKGVKSPFDQLLEVYYSVSVIWGFKENVQKAILVYIHVLSPLRPLRPL